MPTRLKVRPPSPGQLDPLLRVNSIAEFHRQASRLGLLSSNPRFLTLVVDPSNKCNLRCRMCYFRFNHIFKASPVFLTPEHFRSLTENLLAHTRTLTLSCGNEPLTSPYFIDILKTVAGSRLPHLDFVTNGTLLTPRISEAIIDCGVTDVMVSVDSPRKETYEAIRVGADFERLLKNLETLVAARVKTRKTIPRLRFNVTLMRSNIQEVEELVALAANLGVSYLDFRHMLIYEGLGMEEESLFFHQDLSNLWLARARRKAQESGITLVQCPEPFGRQSGTPQTPKRAFPSLIKKAGRLLRENPAYAIQVGGYRLKDLIRRTLFNPPAGDKPYCLLPFSYSLINSGGQVLPCPHCPGEPPAGVITPESPFSEVWLGKGLMELRKRILNNDPPPMCQKCSTRIMIDPDNYAYFQPGKN